MPDVKPQPKEEVFVKDKNGVIITPAKEDGNLASILGKLDITLSSLRDAITATPPDNKTLNDLYSKLNDLLTELQQKTEPNNPQNLAPLPAGTNKIGSVDVDSYPGPLASQLPSSLTPSGNLKVAVLEGGAGGGLSQIQVRDSENTWKDVGYYTGNLNVPVQVQVPVGIKDAAGSQINPAKEDGNLALAQQDLRALLVVLQQLVNSPLQRVRITSDNSLVISGTVYAIQSGTWNLGNFPYHQQWELIQRANIEYNECQRSKFTFI